jgi:hypothetical protein
MSHAGYHPVLDPALSPPFPQAVLPMLRNPQLRKNVAHAIDVIQAKRGRLVADADEGGKMSVPVSARQRIIDRIHSATISVAKGPGELEGAYAALPRSYVCAGRLSGEDRIALMIERLREYDAEVVAIA